MRADPWKDKGVKKVSSILVMSTATTQEEFEHAHKMIDEKHAAYNKVYVDSQGLKNLLYDHSQFCGLFEDESMRQLIKINHGDYEASKEAEHCYRNYGNIDTFEYERSKDETNMEDD